MKKGFKVTDTSRIKKIGIAADDLSELSRKACDKLQVKGADVQCKFYVASDGTLVSDNAYLLTLPAQTLLVMVKPGEEMRTEMDFQYDLVRSTIAQFLEAGSKAQEFLNTNLKDKANEFLQIINRVQQDMSAASERQHDPQWFEGITTKEATKELYMRKKAKDRIRGYFFKMKKMLQSSDIYVNSNNIIIKRTIDGIIEEMRKLLDVNKYNEHYFDRSSGKSMCSTVGVFQCGGLWNNNSCEYPTKHLINPYRSREERILFQTWNLDHRIEFSRSIIPSMLSAVQNVNARKNECFSCKSNVSKNVNVCSKLYYRELFTDDNFKLVHIICHDKGKHAVYSGTYIVCKSCTDDKHNYLAEI